ncbi:MAG: nitrate ABC transporter, permease protein [Bacteroidetes bacterium]|nr:MAG: nitrate ABC transporter, permease protein [Bacteroidota bacterium]
MPIVHNTLKYTWIKIAPFIYFIGSIFVLILLWKFFSWKTNGDIPGPDAGLLAVQELFIDMSPFYSDPEDPNTQGILIMMWGSLLRVFTGFILGSLVAIPIGFLMGSSTLWMNIFNPIVQTLRPVSPLAWFPLGMIALKSASGATIFMIFITSLWPTLINTALGVSSLPADHKNVAKAFGFSTWKYLTKILIPYSLPYIITGLRLSIGVAWMVIVAGEMLSGGQGIGFFVWDSYNGGALEKVIMAIFLIGIAGLILDKVFNYLQKRFSFV